MQTQKTLKKIKIRYIKFKSERVISSDCDAEAMLEEMTL